MRGTPSAPAQRNISSALQALDKEFLNDATDRSMGKLQKFNTFRKESSETVRTYWIRYEGLIGELDRHGLMSAEAVRFIKAFQSHGTEHQSKNGFDGRRAEQ